MIWRLLLGALGALVLAACGAQVWHSRGGDLPPRGEALRLATFNIHYIVLEPGAEGPWSVAGWEARREAVSAMVTALDADILAFQEMESFARGGDGRVNLARDDLLSEHPDYGVAASGDPAVFPSTQPVFYRKSAFQPVDQGWFFFSDTPDVIYSRTYDGGYPAFASWVVFDGPGGRFRVLNLHTDAFSRDNRLRSARLVAARLRPWLAAGERVIVMGDLNARRQDRVSRILADAGLRFLPSRGASVHFNRGLHLFAAIDHIAVSDGVQGSRAVVVQRKYAGVWPGDHHPVVADVTLR